MNHPFGTAIVAAALLVSSQATGGQTKDQTPSSASLISRFTGTWKEDVSKRKIGSMQHLVFRRSASGALEEIRGSELRPMVQQVNFTGKPYSIDGSKNTIAWKQIDPNTFERAIYNEGRLQNTRRIRIAADGKTLTQDTETVTPSAGKTTDTIVYHRMSGDHGLEGRWKPESFKTDTPEQVTYAPVGTNGLKVTTPGNTVTATLDNRAVPLIGPVVIPGTMIAARQIDGSTIETTQSREGVATGKTIRTVSADGRTMTVTTTTFGPNTSREPSVSTYVKQ